MTNILEDIRGALAVSSRATDVTIITQWDSDAYITPSIQDVQKLCIAGADIVAFDATIRTRSVTLGDLIAEIHRGNEIAMADTSNLAEAAMSSRADFVGTTLPGYTPNSTQDESPDFALMRSLSLQQSRSSQNAVWEPAQAGLAVEYGADICCGRLSRVITRRFANAVADLRSEPFIMEK